MTKILYVLLLFLALHSPTCSAEKLMYELYSVNSGGEQTLVSKGTKSYDRSDFALRGESRNESFYGARKELELFNGYSIGILDTLHNGSGFGLTVGHLPFESRPNEFSWEWYEPGKGNVFVKLQGGTRIEVLFIGHPAMTEIGTIKFLDDAEFDYKEDLCCKSKGDGPTHRLKIKAGSVLAFPPHGS